MCDSGLGLGGGSFFGFDWPAPPNGGQSNPKNRERTGTLNRKGEFDACFIRLTLFSMQIMRQPYLHGFPFEVRSVTWIFDASTHQAQEPEAKGKKAQTQSQQPKAKRQTPEARSQKPKARGQNPKAKSQKPEARSQKPEAKSQKPEAKSQKPKARSQKPRPNSMKSGKQSFKKVEKILE